MSLITSAHLSQNRLNHIMEDMAKVKDQQGLGQVRSTAIEQGFLSTLLDFLYTLFTPDKKGLSDVEGNNVATMYKLVDNIHKCKLLIEGCKSLSNAQALRGELAKKLTELNQNEAAKNSGVSFTVQRHNWQYSLVAHRPGKDAVKYALASIPKSFVPNDFPLLAMSEQANPKSLNTFCKGLITTREQTPKQAQIGQNFSALIKALQDDGASDSMVILRDDCQDQQWYLLEQDEVKQDEELKYMAMRAQKNLSTALGFDSRDKKYEQLTLGQLVTMREDRLSKRHVTWADNSQQDSRRAAFV